MQTILTSKKEIFEGKLRQFLQSKKDFYPPKLYEAMEYSLFTEGKRVRPVLMMLTADFLKLDYEVIFPFAISLECIHTYSLIHDDLPSMDNDIMRRGKPTNHVVFGEAMALLAGDCLLNLAYENIIDTIAVYPQMGAAAKYLAQCAGGEGMIGGQALEFSVDKFDEATITELYMKKTGALICASIMIPCLLANDLEKMNDLANFATAVGLCFQLSDDLLDRHKNENNTYLAIMGEERLKSMLEKLSASATKSLSAYEDAKTLVDFSSFLSKRKI